MFEGQTKEIEIILETVNRELTEKTGMIDFSTRTVCVYFVIGKTSGSKQVNFRNSPKLSFLSESDETKEIQCFSTYVHLKIKG